MKKWLYFTVLPTLAIVGFGSLYYFRPWEPHYDGYPLSRWAILLYSADELDREDAVTALAAIGEPAAPALVSGLAARETAVRNAASTALIKMGKPAVPVLQQAVSGDDARLRRGVIFVLGKMGAPAYPALAAALRDRDPNVRRMAIAALGEIGSESKAAREALYRELKKTSPQRAHVARAVGKCGPQAMEAVPFLMKLMKSDNDAVRANVVAALGNIGPAAKPAVRMISAALDDKDLAVQGNAVVALGQIGSPAEFIVNRLLERVQKTNEGNRVSIIQAFEKIGPKAKAALPWLRQRRAQILKPRKLPADVLQMNDELRELGINVGTSNIPSPELGPINAALASITGR